MSNTQTSFNIERMNSPIVKHVSECFIKPKYVVEESKQPCYLAPFDLSKLTSHYIQKGLLFTKRSHLNGEVYSTCKLIESLEESLSLTLVHFYPLAGQLATETYEDRHECLVFVDCNKGPGARFIHATLDMTISDILSPVDVPLVVQSFFDHHKAVDHDGHTKSLLSVQVTELLDGIFIACSANHSVLDGTSYWQFWNMWSEINKSNGKHIPVSRLPIHKRWFPDGYGPNNPLLLPFIHPDEFISCRESTKLRERIFHFSSKSIERLKGKANEQSNTTKISSFQALSALVWRSIVRANCLRYDQVTNCRLTTNCRHRVNPPLPSEYFGNFVSLLKTSTTAGELLENNLGWAASLIHQSIVNHTDKTVRDELKGWVKSPSVPKHGILYNSNNVLISSSPRFNMYGNDFGFGKAVAARSGFANKFEGKVTCYPGCEGGGSVDLEICLPPEIMRAFESDEELMDAVLLR